VAPAKHAEPRANHFVPQCWLAGFTETGQKDGRLWVTDLKRRKQWQTSPPKPGIDVTSIEFLIPISTPTARPRLVNRNLIAQHNTLTMLTADEHLYSHEPNYGWRDEMGKDQTDWTLFSRDKILAGAVARSS
jgi:hypothetical protein